MPRDPHGATPPGTLVRPSADWFTRQTFSDGFNDVEPAASPIGLWLAVGFYNNDPTGRVMRVYAISTVNDNGNQLFANYVPGRTGSFVKLARNLRADYPVSAVEISQTEIHQNFNLPYPFSFGDPFNMFATGGLTAGMYESAFPLAIVPPAYSLVVSNQFGGTQVSVYARWQMADG